MFSFEYRLHDVGAEKRSYKYELMHAFGVIRSRAQTATLTLSSKSLRASPRKRPCGRKGSINQQCLDLVDRCLMFRRDPVFGTYEELPKKTRKAVEDTQEALRYLNENATQAELTISAKGMTLKAAALKTEDLLARAKLFDSDSIKTLAKVAPIWGFVTTVLIQKQHVAKLVQEKLERASRLDQAEGAQIYVSGQFEGDLVRALEKFHQVLD